MSEYTELGTTPASRRKFMATMAAAGLGAAAANVFGGKRAEPKIPLPPIDPLVPKSGGTHTQTAVTNTIPASDFTGIPGSTIDFQVLNFALTLEILEADIYRQALNMATGYKLSTPLFSDHRVYQRGVGTGGLSSQAANVAYYYLRDFAYVEAAHRDFLTAAIKASGGTPTTANKKGYAFPTKVSAEMRPIMSAILPLEETGTRAYLGALRSFTSSSLAQTAATIFSTECRHSAAIRYILGQDPGPSMMAGDSSDPTRRPSTNTYEYFLEPQTVLKAASVYFVK